MKGIMKVLVQVLATFGGVLIIGSLFGITIGLAIVIIDKLRSFFN